MTSETNTAPTSSTGAGKDNAKEAPKYRMDPAEIPTPIRQLVAKEMGTAADVYPAKDGGNYKGRVVHADDKFIVQAIGKGEKTAIVHDRSEVEIKGAALLSRAANNDLGGRNVQIHYRDADKGAAMYPHNAEKEQQQREGGKSLYQATMTELYTKMAREYAEQNISSPKQRAEFLKHFDKVTERVVSELQKDRPEASKTDPEKAKPEPEKSAKAQEAPQQAQGKPQPSQDR
ncbi:KfrB domain-containing protein (plasmid) [Agrobacterium sp. rho-13.3]|uniref:KfrB domain-containing protein n=1 Tax=Agrobacterium sp. rho-13.3 TaxID=3072980 RepID=UPI002A0ADBC9|nr:hypothetical protein [Agrobacterium sp. rho-13.3]MDX8311521.1 hypothetical protein [Agrobacterium sp. rho-13.3]